MIFHQLKEIQSPSIFPKVEEGSYPHLFPDGKGGEKDPNRPIPETTREYIQARLRVKNSPFQADKSWPFRSLLNLSKSDLMRAIRFVQNKAASKGKTDITSRELLELMESYDDFEATGGGNIRSILHDNWKCHSRNGQLLEKS